MEKFFEHLPYWILILVLMIIFGIRYTAPQVTTAVKSISQVATPSVQVTEYPIMGCSLSRIYMGAYWR